LSFIDCLCIYISYFISKNKSNKNSSFCKQASCSGEIYESKNNCNNIFYLIIFEPCATIIAILMWLCLSLWKILKILLSISYWTKNSKIRERRTCELKKHVSHFIILLTKKELEIVIYLLKLSRL